MLAKSTVGMLLPLIFSPHSKQIKSLSLDACIFLRLSCQPGFLVKGKGRRMLYLWMLLSE